MQTIQDLEQKVEALKESREKLLNKKNNIFFFLTESEVESAAVYEIYLHAKYLKDIGYSVKIITDTDNYQHPKFLDEDMKTIEIFNISKKDNNLTISPCDYLIIPELFTNIMHQVHQQKLPCSKIVLFQSYTNAFKGMLPAASWKEWGINNVITTSKAMTDYLKEYFGKEYDIQTWKLGIPDYFKPSDKPKKSVITFFSRNPKEVELVIKSFYAKYPHLRFITFQEIKNFTREELGKVLGQSIATIWIDRHAAHGTIPLEAMKANSIPIGIIPELEHNQEQWFIKDNTGIWLKNILKIPEYLSKIVMSFIQDQMPEEVQKGMKEISEKYSVETSKQSILKAYQFYFVKRDEEFKQFIESNTKVIKEYKTKETENTKE